MVVDTFWRVNFMVCFLTLSVPFSDAFGASGGRALPSLCMIRPSPRHGLARRRTSVRSRPGPQCCSRRSIR